MLPVEVGCLAVLLAFAYAWRGRLRDRRFLTELGCVALAAWLTEDTCIRFYGFYEYHAPWSVFVDEVPLLVALIWPVVILAARDVALARSRYGDVTDPIVEARGVGRTGMIVLADAALIEPVAVHAGLWRWTVEGPLGVPPIGILGWSIFAWCAALAMITKRVPFMLALPIVLTHAMLLAMWWGFFRWIPFPSDGPAAVGLAVIAAVVTLTILRGPALAIPGNVLVARFAAACFFFALLASGAPPAWPLALWAGSFLPPWLALTVLRSRPAETQ